MNSILALSLQQNVSDLHLSSGENIILRQNGKMIVQQNTQLAHQQLEQKLLCLLSDKQQQILKLNKQIDLSYQDPQFGRFRINIFYQQKGIAAAFRIIKSQGLTLEQINAPEIFKQLCCKAQGLILITGATGSGKSTTLSAMINYINHHQCRHIITLEDPIEYLYQNDQSLIQQREIGEHCLSYLDGLMAALRQDPDIIMLGELRDKQTIEAALQAAETGHLVLATLHTNGAIETINRIVNVFADESREFIRQQLANSLQAIIAQQLITDEQQRQAVFEILINIPAVSHLIQEAKIKQITSIMQTGSQYGMQLMPNGVNNSE